MRNPTLKARFKALFYDYLIILGWMSLLGAVSLIIYLIYGSIPDYLGMFGPLGAEALFFALLTLPVGLYLFFTESGSFHATFGKRKAGLVVTGYDSKTVSRSRIAIRTVVKLLPWETAHLFMWQMQYVFYQYGYDAMPPAWVFIGLNVATGLAIIYVAMVVIRADARGPHDLIAGTKVVLKK